VTKTSARDLVVDGHVQGVFFRAFVQDAAQRAGVAGSAVNLPDGSLRVRLEGPPDAVAEVEQAVRRGPRDADVERVDGRDVRPQGLTGFRVG
jgi:acylphosphatase